jgi:hypothetical protein
VLGARGEKRNNRGGANGHSVLLQEVLRRIYLEYRKTHRLPGYLHRAMWALMACRTAELGTISKSVPRGMSSGCTTTPASIGRVPGVRSSTSSSG